MILRLFVLFFLSLQINISSVLSAQIPTVNGVIGGHAQAITDGVKFNDEFVIFAAATTTKKKTTTTTKKTSTTTKKSTTTTSTASATPTRTPGKLRGVVENSGVCETTPGVYQASGYGDLNAAQSIWFWFFAARTNSATAPLVLWFNGGPGSSSMIGLFQEHGPCRMTNDSTSVTLNPYSWNGIANMVYIDQPVGVGFSTGTTTVNTTQGAAEDIWNFIQIFLADARFSKYAGNSLGIWTESYGGHYGPAFADYFLTQNSAIKAGTAKGVNLNLKYLGIGDGLTDPITQYPSFMTYAGSNPYHPLVNSTVISTAQTYYSKSGGCADQIYQCNSGGNSTVWNFTACLNAQQNCNDDILGPLSGPYDPYYVPSKTPDAYPPALTPYILNTALQAKIGALQTWKETNYYVYFNFAYTGDWMRTSKPLLQNVINAGVRTILFVGQADYLLNYYGLESMIASMSTTSSTLFNQQAFTNWNVAGQLAGEYKNAGTFSYLRIYGAGHEVAAYKYGTLAYGQAAYQMFSQIMGNNPLSST